MSDLFTVPIDKNLKSYIIVLSTFSGVVMCDRTTKITVRTPEERTADFEMDATIFQGKVCVSFKCNGTGSHIALANQLRSMLHEESDPSIVQKDGVHTMSTKFPGIPDMIDFLRRMGLRCQETDQLSGGIQKIRFMGDEK